MKKLSLVAVGFVIGALLSYSYVNNERSKDKIKQHEQVLKQQDKIKQLEKIHAEKEADIIATFTRVKKDHENTIIAINADYSDSLLKHEERADYYRQEYQQCNSKSNADRAIRFDRAITEGITLVEELEAFIKLTEWQIRLNNEIIENDREFINK